MLSKRKRNTIVEELKKYKYSYSADSAGQHIIVDFGEDTEEIIKRASEKKIKIYPIKDYYYKETSDRRIILGYAKMSIDKIKLGMKELLKK